MSGTQEKFRIAVQSDILLGYFDPMDPVVLEIPGMIKDPGRSLWKDPKVSAQTLRILEKNHDFQSREPPSSELPLEMGERGSIRVGEWQAQAIGCKVGSRMYCTTRGIQPVFVITGNGSNL